MSHLLSKLSANISQYVLALCSFSYPAMFITTNCRDVSSLTHHYE
jgi:hypothetical protein